MVAGPVGNHPYQARRPVQPGDVNILLAAESTTPALLKHQLDLQARFGGRLLAPVHLTFQRLVLPHERLPFLVEQFQHKLEHFTPFPVYATDITWIYSSFRQGYILKWVSTSSAKWLHFCQIGQAILQQSHLSGLYPDDRQPPLITALVGIEKPTQEAAKPEMVYPKPLFIASRLLISQIDGPNEFTILADIPLPTQR